MKRMKKLICLLTVLVLILGATYAVKLLDPANKIQEETEKTVVFSVKAEDVTELGWDYSEPILFRASEEGWIYEKDSAFPVDADYLALMLDTLSEVTASKTIEDVENWDQYGLEVPVCTVTVTAGETYTLSIGSETSMGGERYFSNGDGKVYLVDAGIMDDFSYGLYDVLKTESIPSMTDITGLEVVSDVQNYTLTYLEDSGLTYSDEYVWFLEDKALDTELTEALISTITKLRWVECVNFHAEDLSVYGLETPAAEVTVNYTESVSVSTGEMDDNGETVFETKKYPVSFTLEIGNKSGGYCYARISGSDMIYTIDSSVLDTLLYTSYYELQPDEVVLMDWTEVESMDITLDGETYTFAKEIKTVTDEDGNESEETVFVCSGDEMDADIIFDAIDAIASTGYATGLTPERNEEIRLVFHRSHAQFPDVELVFYQYDSTACMTTLNGKTTVFADREAVVALVEAVNALVLDE